MQDEGYVALHDEGVRDHELPPRAAVADGNALVHDNQVPAPLLVPLLPLVPGAAREHDHHVRVAEAEHHPLRARVRAVGTRVLYAILMPLTIYHVMYFCGASSADSTTAAWTSAVLHRTWICFKYLHRYVLPRRAEAVRDACGACAVM